MGVRLECGIPAGGLQDLQAVQSGSGSRFGNIFDKLVEGLPSCEGCALVDLSTGQKEPSFSHDVCQDLGTCALSVLASYRSEQAAKTIGMEG